MGTMDMQLGLVSQGLLCKAKDYPPTDGNCICILLNTALYKIYELLDVFDSGYMMHYLYQAGFAKKDINCSLVQIKKGFNFLHRYHSIPTEAKQDLQFRLKCG